MSLIPYEPFRQLENLRREFDQFFTTDFNPLRNFGRYNFAMPSIDIHETDNELLPPVTCRVWRRKKMWISD